jgi:hypothetical protein
MSQRDPRFGTSSWGKYNLLYVLCIAIICFLAAKLLSTDWQALSHVLASVGEALIISIVVILLVEARSKEHFMQHILSTTDVLKTNAFLGGFGYGLPQKYIVALKDLISQAKLTREHFQLSLSIKESNSDVSPISLIGTVSYTLLNHTSNALPHSHDED